MNTEQKLRKALRQNVRAFRDVTTGEIKYSLTGNDSDLLYEDVMIIRNLSNETIDHILEQPAQVEPVAWQFFCENDKKWFNGSEMHNHRKNTEQAGYKVRNLYTTPQPVPLVRLTDEEIEKLVYPHYNSTESFVAGINFDLKIAKAVMDAMQKKNGGAA